jgi:mannose-6-phosphate isomerase-like protein (cupin superfamily)
MKKFPTFMKSQANRIAGNSQATPGAEGYVCDGVDGSQMAFWTCTENAIPDAHVHHYDEYMVVLSGRYTVIANGSRIPVLAGEEMFIPQGLWHGREVLAGTRTIHAFGGRRAKRIGSEK